MLLDTQNEITPVLDGEIRRFETGRFAWPRFPAALEFRYGRETAVTRTGTLLAQGFLSLLVYEFFLVGDYFMAPEHLLRAIVVRLGLFTPLALLVSLIAKALRSEAVHEKAATLLCLLAACSILFLDSGANPLVAVESQMGLALVLLVMNCLMSIDLRYAGAATLLVVGADAAWFSAQPMVNFSEKMISGGMLGWVGVLSLAANYTMARERRFSYLLQLRGRLQRGLLAEANAELMAISSTDSLTGLPNRHAYDTRLQEVWAMTRDAGVPLSAVMVDVDHFKRLNDSYGHPYGDRVLQRIASLLQQALRGEEDFVARYGGEEFVVLLPNTDLVAAVKVAERIRTLVQVAGSPALQKDCQVPEDIWATVSCGVATMPPGTSITPLRLIAAADSAMYCAKQEGRNRVCSATAPTAPQADTLSAASRG